MKKNNVHKAIFLKDYTPSSFLIESAHLQFILDPTNTIVNAKLEIKRNPKVKTSARSITFDGINLDLQAIKLNGRLLTTSNYQITDEHLTIHQVPDNFVLETIVKVHPKQNLTCTGLFLTNGNFCTQNEPNGFRHLTYFIDRPDILTKFTTTIIADKKNYPVLLSNGNLIAKKELQNNKHSVTWLDPFPKSQYLFALIAGKLGYIEDYHITTSGRKIKLRIFARNKDLSQCKHAMASLKQAMAWDEQNFGLEYDLDMYQIVAINDLNIGAMENKGLNVFNSDLLLASKTTTSDADFNKITAVIAHEYFHNWTGNRVTCRDWFQIGLKEGLTTLREQLFMEDLYGQIINRINSIKIMRTKQFAEDAGPLAHPIRLQSYIEVNNFYTITVYEKSAEVARMLYTIFGKKTFQTIMKNFLAKFDGHAITIEDFLQTAAMVTKTNLEQFKLWYDQAGTPTLNISDNFTKNKTYTLKIKQKHNKSKDFYIPLAIALINPNGKNSSTKTLIINKNKQAFSFPKLAAKPVPSLLRNFSAPVKIEYAYSDDELLLLLCHDQDPINRWNASQALMTNIVMRLYKKVRTKAPLVLPPILINAFKKIIGDNKTESAIKAQILQLPTESYLIEAIPHVDIVNLHYIYEFLELELAKKLKLELLECYKKQSENKSYTLNAISIGKRSLKNLCLYYLMHLNAKEIFTVCLEQLKHSDNMTDTYACLSSLTNSNYSKREQLLEKYYRKWQDQPNLLDKWLTLNASIKLPKNLRRIQKLMRHSAFNIKNPNNVYSLIRTFCENNHINFHEANGAGYRFLAEQVLTIDRFNPQLAATIILPLTRGHKFDKKRERMMKQQLLRIYQKPKISKNIYEIVGKALNK